MGLGQVLMEEVVFGPDGRVAILNAIYDAMGVLIDELPASPERILKGLQPPRERSG
jgi:CO/xanthine dehydrogenase Mo-binding subunit